MKYLVLADADGVHDYIFASHELKLIRGASQLQKGVMEQTLPAWLGEGELIFAGGGRILAEFDKAARAAEFEAIVEREFRRATAVATATTAAVGYDGTEFRQALERSQDLLEMKKSGGGGRFGRMRGNWYFSVCARCGMEPGVFVRDEKATCAPCGLRIDASDREALNKELPESFADIAKAGRPENYIALVYLDMDRLGRFLWERANSKAEYRKWSTDIDAAVQAGVRKGLASSERNEVLVIGGDDAIVVLPPQEIFRFAAEFYDSIQSSLAERPSCSMGILIAHHQYPIRDFVAGAEQLLRSAKRKGGDRIDYAVLTESMTESVVAGRDMGADGAYRTAKPYLCDDFVNLGPRLGTLKAKVSSTRLKAVARLISEDETQALLEYCYLMRRAPEIERAELRNVIGTSPWKEIDGDKRTEAADLMELWRMVS